MGSSGARRPWGLNPWLFWVVALFVAGALGNVPAVGTVLLLLALAGAFVIWFRTPRPRSQVQASASPRIVPTAEARSSVSSRWGEIEVQGESFRRDSVRRLFEELGLEEGGVTHQTATLVPEPSNPYDATAVKVLVGKSHIGYVPAELSAQVTAELRRKRDSGAAPVRIWADPRDGLWRARATLFPSSIESDRDFAAERVVRTPEPSPPAMAEVLELGDTIDLSHLESVRMRIKGVANYVGFDERAQVGATQYRLIREPGNLHDTNAVVVAALDGRKIGYVSAARAQMIASCLDEMGAGSYLVGGASVSDTSSRLWVDVPKAEALRRFAKGRS